MSGIVNGETKNSFDSANKEEGLVKWPFKDEVFSGPRERDIKELNEKFQMMKTMEMQVPGAVTDLLLNPMMNSLPPTIVTQKVYPGRSKQIFNINDSKYDILAGVDRYAAEASLTTIDAGMREAFKVYSNFNVPRIVVDSVADVENSNSCNGAIKSSVNLCKSRHLPNSEPRRKNKNYFRPYCILNRRHYACRSFTHRHRKYGVSQKNSGFQGMEELTHMLDRMGTNETKLGKSGKWQYSPPPKICCVQYRPPVGLSGIEEKSRSTNDLNFKALNISSPIKTSRNASNDQATGGSSDVCSFFNSHNTESKNEGSTLDERMATRMPVEQVLTKLNGLNMEESL